MKANPALRQAARTATAFVALAALTVLSSCSERRVAPSPAPTPTPRPAPPPAPGPAADWRDAPITPGDWTWSMEGGASVARFAGGQLVMRCNRAAGTVEIMRAGQADGNVPMTIVTDAASRPVTGIPHPGAAPALVVSLPARDPLLDAMAFSRGRFAIETAGLPTLYVPSWPEVSRVVEDCR